MSKLDVSFSGRVKELIDISSLARYKTNLETIKLAIATYYYLLKEIDKGNKILVQQDGKIIKELRL